MTVTIYDYFASENPYLAEQIINSFGYKVTDRSNLGRSLKELVANVGEPAVKKIMENHPDKAILMEMQEPKKTKVEAPMFIEQPMYNKPCGCNGCRSRENGFYNASGETNTGVKEANTLANQTNVILLVSALFIATALIIKTNK